MSHYFTEKADVESNPKEIYFNIKENKFHFTTDNGVFSKSGLDFGSRLLIESIIDVSKEKVLDLGCGYGPIGIVYKSFQPNSEVVLSDINLRALRLATKNADRANVKVKIQHSNGYEGVNEIFNMIISNPPIRSGKHLLYQLLEESKNYLCDDGELVFVIHKKLGADSAMAFCGQIYRKVTVLNKKSGYYIIQCIK